MKKVHKDKIVNVDGTDTFDNMFQFEYLDWAKSEGIEVVFLGDILKKRKNEDILKKVKEKPAMWSEVYSPKDELEIFENVFDTAIQEKKRTHIVGVTLKEEIEILEEYYEKLGFLREDINCFDPDFGVPLVTVSVCIENLIWKGSDYKRMGKKIFFTPPIRESGQTKAMFKGINRGVTAGIYIKDFNKEIEEFLSECIKEERVLPLTLGKVLKYNLGEAGLQGKSKDLQIKY